MVASYRVTLLSAFYSTVAVALVGLLLAWIVSRYDFPGRRLLDSLIDLPFALPTAVAGLTLATLLSPNGWIGQLFAAYGHQDRVRLPRAGRGDGLHQPAVHRAVRAAGDRGSRRRSRRSRPDAAARRAVQTFWRVILPTLRPPLLAGCSQAFIRSLGEFGAVVMIAGNIPFQTEVTSLMIFVRLQEFNYPAAAAIASVVLLASLLLLFTLQVVQVRLMGWQRSR